MFSVCSLYEQLVSFPGHHGSPHLGRNSENAAHTGAKSLAPEKLSSKLGGKRDIYEVIVCHVSWNMIKDLNEGPNKNGFVRSRGGENRRWGLPGGAS